MLQAAIVLDANILIRYSLGRRVGPLMAAHAARVNFLAPDTAFVEARRNLPAILASRVDSDAEAQAALEALNAAFDVVTSIPLSSYDVMRLSALARIRSRDPDDWPVIACALLLTCPIWTEDRDFFGTGVATWTTARVELYFKEASSPEAGH